VEVCLRSFVTVNIKLQAKFRCSFIRFVRLASFVSLARTSPYKKKLTKQTENVTRITKILKCCNEKRATSRHAMRYGVTTHMMIWWFFVTLLTQNTAAIGDPKCITFNNCEPNVKKGGSRFLRKAATYCPVLLPASIQVAERQQKLG
jgi:hypothetical protein